MEYRFRKISLNKHIIISFATIITLTIITIGGFIHITFKTEFSKYVDKGNKKEVEHLVYNIRNMYLFKGWSKENIKLLAEEAVSKGMALEVYDSENNLIWSIFEDDKMLYSETLSRISENMQKIDNNWSNDLDEYKFDIYNEEQKLAGYGKIIHFKSIYYLENDIDFLIIMDKILVLISIFSIGSVIAIAIVISKSISNPIEEVSKMAKDIGEGKTKSILECDSSIQEVDELIYSINKLSMELNNQEILRTRLTTDIAHELRTPITSVQGHLDAIIDGIWEATPQRLMSIREEITRISYLIGELRKLAKYESEKNKLVLNNTNIKALIQNIAYNYESIAVSKNITINYDLLEIWTKVDKNQISQAIVNLLSNAIKYTDYGGKIDLKLYEDYNNVYISVKDNGVGIPKSDVNNIFERFYRVDRSRNSETGGIGVGLTIVKSIVSQHDGEILVKSDLGVGTEFIIKIKR